jgi:ribonuclease HI
MVIHESFWKILSCTLVVVFQFDGSLRPPRDPGFPTIPSRMGTCASCISTNSNPQTKEAGTVPLAVGGRFLPIPVDMTSAHAEYEGLLLGLEWLCEQLPSHRLVEPKRSATESSVLLIQGDCKTVIDQLSGKSLSRKLQGLYQQAKDLLDPLEEEFFDRIEFEHIPRSENSVCDNVCANLITAVASSEWKSCWNELETLLNVAHPSAAKQLVVLESSGTKTKRKQNKKNTPLSDILTRYLGPNTRSRIKYSIRPALYNKFASIAKEIGDFETLIQVGELLAATSQLCSAPSNNTNKSNNNKYFLMARGVGHQMDGWRGLGMEKKALALQRKHRVLLQNTSICDSTATTRGQVSESSPEKRTVASSWDESIPEAWCPLLNEWWTITTTASKRTYGEEGSELWVDVQSDRQR